MPPDTFSDVCDVTLKLSVRVSDLFFVTSLVAVYFMWENSSCFSSVISGQLTLFSVIKTYFSY